MSDKNISNEDRKFEDFNKLEQKIIDDYFHKFKSELNEKLQLLNGVISKYHVRLHNNIMKRLFEIDSRFLFYLSYSSDVENAIRDNISHKALDEFLNKVNNLQGSIDELYESIE